MSNDNKIAAARLALRALEANANNDFHRLWCKRAEAELASLVPRVYRDEQCSAQRAPVPPNNMHGMEPAEYVDHPERMPAPPDALPDLEANRFLTTFGHWVVPESTALAYRDALAAKEREDRRLRYEAREREKDVEMLKRQRNVAYDATQAAERAAADAEAALRVIATWATSSQLAHRGNSIYALCKEVLG